MTLTPAYGRDYKSVKEVKAALSAGKDFVIADVMHKDCGRYCSANELVGTTPVVTVRYNKLRSVTVVDLRKL